MQTVYARLAACLVTASVICGTASMGGCDTMVSDERVDNAIRQVGEEQVQLQNQIKAASTEAEKADLNVQLQAANLAAQQLLEIKQKLAEASKSADAISGTITAIGSAVPIPGVNTVIAALGGTGIIGGIASWLSRQKYAKVANQIIAGINAAKDPRKNPGTADQLAAALKAAEPWIHSAMDVGTIEKVRSAIKTGKL